MITGEESLDLLQIPEGITPRQCPQSFERRDLPMSGHAKPVSQFCAVILMALALTSQLADAQQTREHILLARQVGVPMSQGLVVLVTHELSHVAPQRQCRKSGSVIVYDTTDPADPIAVGDPAPFSLAEGESVAFPNIQPMRLGATGSASGISQGILDIWLVSDQPPAASCGDLAVTVYGWDAATKKTIFETGGGAGGPPQASTPAGPLERITLGFLGLGSEQAGRVLLSQWTDFNASDPGAVPSAQCDFSGEIIAETIPQWDPSDSSPPAPPLRQTYPVKWVGPATAQKRMTKAELIDIISTAPSGARAELLLTLELKSRQPAACRERLEGSLQVVETTTSETTTNAPILNRKYRPQFYLRPFE
jgi:hypothetical protein